MKKSEEIDKDTKNYIDKRIKIKEMLQSTGQGANLVNFWAIFEDWCSKRLARKKCNCLEVAYTELEKTVNKMQNKKANWWSFQRTLRLWCKNKNKRIKPVGTVRIRQCVSGWVSERVIQLEWVVFLHKVTEKEADLPLRRIACTDPIRDLSYVEEKIAWNEKMD